MQEQLSMVTRVTECLDCTHIRQRLCSCLCQARAAQAHVEVCGGVKRGFGCQLWVAVTHCVCFRDYSCIRFRTPTGT